MWGSSGENPTKIIDTKKRKEIPFEEKKKKGKAPSCRGGLSSPEPSMVRKLGRETGEKSQRVTRGKKKIEGDKTSIRKSSLANVRV